MHERHHQWYSKYLSRHFEMLSFGHAGYPIVLFPTSNGRYYQNKDFGLVGSIRHLIDAGAVHVYCPDSIDSDSWYNNSIHPADRVKTHIAYEKLIVHDVIDLALRESGAPNVAVGGCSFGGYHAMNLAFRHPDLVGYVISLGGSFDIKQFIHGYYDDNCYFNNPPDYVPNLSDPWYLERINRMGIVLGTGEHDICRGENEQFAHILRSKGIQHWLDVRPGGYHDWPCWNQVFPEYCSLIKPVYA
jgi:esterase/lipase superfamily enzyme